MNILFLTRSDTLNLFYDLSLYLKKNNKINNTGFILSDSFHYKMFLKKNSFFENENLFIKEWEILKKLKEKPDYDLLNKYQKLLNVNHFWDAILADRRIIYGKNYAYRQDYKSNFSIDEIHNILTIWLVSIDNLIKKLKPDVIVSFISTYTGEYLTYLFSKTKKIPFLNLRPTRVENYMHFALSPNEPSDIIKNTYKSLLNSNYNSCDKLAQDFINNSYNKKIKYEGVFLNNQLPPQANFKIPNFLKVLNNLKKIINSELNYRLNNYKCDRHVPGYFKPLIYRLILNPLLIKKVNIYLSNKYIDQKSLSNLNYAFFPLHIEPEVTLSVYSKPYLNQIEVIRNIAYNLPFNMKLIVKEHPAAVGKRPVTFYKKILNIPNVELIRSEVETKTIIQYSKLVATISGSVGFEAIIYRKPVITFGNTPYEILPKSMITKVENLNLLGKIISNMLTKYSYKEKNLLSYISSVINNSVSINFYTVLLKRKDQYKLNNDNSYINNIKRLGDYLIKTFKSQKSIE